MNKQKGNIIGYTVAIIALVLLVCVIGFTKSSKSVGGISPVNEDAYSFSVYGSPVIGHTGNITPAGGISGVTGQSVPTVFHTGGAAPSTTTTGTDTTPATTTTYISEIYIPVNTTLTGLSVLNGSVATGSTVLALADSTGAIVAQTASTAVSGTAAYQQIPFTSTYTTKGPAKYFVLLQDNNTANRFRSHILGNFGAFTVTGGTYGTLTSITATSTFTTNVGPIADTY